MAPEPFSRRSFLALTGGAVLLAACGGGDDSGTDAAPATDTTDPNALVSSVVSSDLYASDAPQRFAFILQTQQHAYASGAAATIAIKPPNGTLGPPTPATLHTEGLPGKRGVYVVEPRLPVSGVYTSVVEAKGTKLELPFQVKPKPQAPAVGTSAPVAASPTKANPLGVKPLCTRTPACPLHERSLADLVGKGRPVAVMFATPALCQTQYCGPVLDTLLPYTDRYAGRIDFVHVEIYRDDSATTVSPTVEAWALDSEPWLFGIDRSGKVVARLDGAFAGDEIGAVLDQIV